MSYQVLALKYRPQTFEQVVGQEHVTTTLSNAIRSDRVAHAILLTGPRGTGKTTIARILAKAMTCSQGPAPEPCNQCKICTDIIHGHCADVFEIDGASNNSVEQIRDLRENVAYMPASARFKIYIIDEVHMLSTAAFNALLKTLEEPPDHVLFIFATTEVHKIPATILSRCQRHDLARIALDRISDHLGHLCEQEGFAIEKESLDLVALEADGSIRDSLSLLDRILSASPEKVITATLVSENLGTSDRQLMFDLSDAVITRNGNTLIHLVQRVNDAGLDLKKFYADTIAHFRNLNIVKICGKDTPSLNLIEAEKDRLEQTVSQVTSLYTGMLLQRLLDDESLVRYASHTQTAVEMVLLKLIQISPGADVDNIISKLDSLARQIDAQPAVSKPVAPAPVPVRPPAQPPTPAPPSQPAAPPPPEPVEYPPMQEAADPIVPDQATYAPDPPPYMDAPAATGSTGNMHTAQTRPTPEAKTDSAEDQGPVSWPQFLTILQTKLPSMYALLSRARADTDHPDHIAVALTTRSEFEKKRIETKDKPLQALSMQWLKKPIKLNMTDGATQSQGPSESQMAQDQARQSAARHPLVQEAQRIFNGRIL